MIIPGVSIQYGDIAVGAKENFTSNASESQFGDNYKSDLQKYNMQIYNYANPCETYQTALDGTATFLPSQSSTQNANIGLWSTQLSNTSDGTFTQSITLTLTSNGQFSSQGFTFTFDRANNIYPTSLKIQWYRVEGENETLIHEETFTPTSAFYFCRYKAENFNKAVITFYSLNMPKNRLKLYAIDFGYGTVWYGDELTTVTCTQEIDPISYEIYINSTDFTLNSKSDIIYSFQTEQPLITRHNNNLISSTFIKNSKRVAEHLWEVQSDDYIGLMNNIYYPGGIYENKNAYDLLVDIFNTSKVPYDIDVNIKNLTITGYIPYVTCREALNYVAFAIQYIVSTAYTDKVKIYKVDNNVSQTIKLNRIVQGQNFENTDIVTGVVLSVYKYTKSNEVSEVYKASENGTGENIFIKFSEPLYNLSISNGEFVKDKFGNNKMGPNFAYINAYEDCILKGKLYKQTETQIEKNNPLILANQKENIISISGNTLITNSNAKQVLNSCYDFLTKTQTTKMNIIDRRIVSGGEYILWGNAKWGTFVWGGTEPWKITYDKITCIGDKITAQTQYLGDVTGIITKQTFSLTGNNVNKETELK